MIEFRKIYWIWYRDVLRYWREKTRIITSLVTPLLWLLIFGSGMRAVEMPGLGNYQAFLFPGVLGMTLLFTSISAGISVIWDREFGFLKEILVAPVSRSSIVLGKALGGATSALVQGIILLPLSYLVGANLSFLSMLVYIPLMIIIAVGLVSIGLTIAAFVESMESFNMIMSFAIMPMFLLSGAFFPMNAAPQWLRLISYIDPLTYGVDILRWATFSGWETLLPPYIEIIILVVFAVVLIYLCGRLFGRQK
jgi:ABC-2 type transport system permease protein